jgi:uncharacterized membrane protein (UPF0136 family)
MHPSFRDGNPSEDGKGTSLYFGIERTLFEKGDDLGVIASMGVVVMAPMVFVNFVSMRMMMTMLVVPVVVMMVSGLGRPFPLIHLITFMATHQKAPSGDAGPVCAFEAAGGKIDSERPQCLLKNFLRNPEIPQCGNGHVAADSSKGIDMKEFHDGWGLAGGKVVPSIHSHLLLLDTAMQKKLKHHVAKSGHVCFNFISKFLSQCHNLKTPTDPSLHRIPLSITWRDGPRDT